MAKRTRNHLELWVVLAAIFVNGMCIWTCLVLLVLSGVGEVFEVFLPFGRVSVGSAAPDFELATLSGGTFHLSDHLGQPVVVSFGTTW